MQKTVNYVQEESNYICKNASRNRLRSSVCSHSSFILKVFYDMIGRTSEITCCVLLFYFTFDTLRFAWSFGMNHLQFLNSQPVN